MRDSSDLHVQTWLSSFSELSREYKQGHEVIMDECMLLVLAFGETGGKMVCTEVVSTLSILLEDDGFIESIGSDILSSLVFEGRR